MHRTAFRRRHRTHRQGSLRGGLEPHEFAGSSLRAGMVTSDAENGVAESAQPAYIEARVGVFRQYIRPVEKRQQSLTNDIGL
jgi:hypothetical protein